MVPHFEKMLYDNAILAIAYKETYQVTKSPQLKETVSQIIKYVFRDMWDAMGDFIRPKM